MKIRIQILLTSLISIFLMIVVAAITFMSISSMLTNIGWVIHTYEVIGKANQMTASMVNQETGMRGYLVTGDEIYLEPYINGEAEFDKIIKELVETVSDNPSQVEKLGEIEQMAASWKTEAAEQFMAVKDEVIMGEQLREEIQTSILNGDGKTRMDALRKAIDESEGNPEALDQLILGMINLETGLRGYLLSQDEVFLEPYNNNLANVSALLKVLEDDKVSDMADDWVNSYAEVLIEKQRVVSNMKRGEDLNDLMATNIGKTYMDAIRDEIDEFVSIESELLAARTGSSQRTSTMTRIVLGAGVLISILISVPLSFLISARINRQLGGEPHEVALITEAIADGNLNVKFDEKRHMTGIYKSVFDMSKKLNGFMVNINAASEQVAGGSRQVSDSSMSLSQGATEQASTIEELTASIEEISAQTKTNSRNADRAKEISGNAMSIAQQGNDQMDDMLKAMAEINNSSKSISNIIKVIDDIAFQTNILALNAAVEAARAGEHGKGFAVVAEEVRNLAARSANAAKETTEMIESSINKVKDGTGIANDTADALSKIVDGVSRAAELVNQIAVASEEQSVGVEQINLGISQISDVVQTASATAQETASASEELSSQAEMLKEQVSTFKLSRDESTGGEELNPEVFQMLDNMKSPTNKDAHFEISLSNTEFDKY